MPSGNVRAIDAADFIISQIGSMSAMKMHKLLYYSQAWTLVWTQQPLFQEEFQAWANGPVVREIFDLHKGCFTVHGFGGDASRLSDDQKDAVSRVLKYYGDKDPQWLSSLTHMESPWQEARVGYANGDRCENIVTKESMLAYYSGL
jgi:uncharacterized phage-associated protein